MSNTYMPLYGVFDTTTGALQGVCPVSGVTSSISGQPVSITGTPTVGQVLTAALATGWTAGGYQWTRDGANISGATSATYTLVSADSGHTVGVTVSTLVYAPTGQTIAAGAAVAPAITTVPVISAITAGAAVTWTTGSASGSPTPTLTYALKKNGTVVSSPATSGAYSSTTAGDIFIVTLTATNSAGTASQDSSQVTVTSGSSFRFASTNNYIATSVNLNNLGTSNAQTDILQSQSHIIGQDVTSINLGMTLQWVKNATGISNVGNGLTVMEMAVVYNGVAVAVTSGGLSTWTIADASNWTSDALASTSFASAAKFTKGTWLQIRVRFRSTASTTDKFPAGQVGRPGVDVGYYLDPAKQTITTGVMATAAFAYTSKIFSTQSAVASGTTVTLTMDTTNIVSGTSYIISGATGTGNALYYNQDPAVLTVTTVGGAGVGQATYTATAGAPAATGTGTIVATGKNGRDAANGVGTVPIYVLANHSSPAVLFVGDSKTHGTNDTTPATALIGMSRTLVSDATNPTTAVCSGINMGCPSGISMELFTATASGVVANHEYWYTLCNHAIVGYGTNGQNTTDQATLWSHIRAKGITQLIQRSLTPRTTSTATVSAVAPSTPGAGTVTLTVPSSFITNLGLTVGQTFTGAVTGATPTGYNTTVSAGVPVGATMTVASATTLTYSNATTGTATGTILIGDMWETLGNQVPHSLWATGQLADTFEVYCRNAVASDANLTFYQSTAERAGTSGANYWLWKAGGATANYATWDGLHESATGYELNIRTPGTVTTQSGGTVAGSLATLVAAFT